MDNGRLEKRVKEQIGLLIQLQELDLELNHQKDEQKNFPTKLKMAEQPLLQARAAFTELKATFEQLNKRRKDKELELQVAEEKIPKLKSRLTELKTNKEYHAHLLEIETAKREKEKIEEQLLMVMEEGDLFKKDLASKELILGAEEKKFASERKEMENRIRQISETAKGLEQEWASLAERIEEGLLKEYKRLYSNRKGLAVAPLKGNICSGCHFSLPPQLVAEVKKQEKIITCSYCHRMLYVKSS
ncbi:MAG: zinc ribbon domain-containing protein [Nitrospiria bacterium]